MSIIVAFTFADGLPGIKEDSTVQIQVSGNNLVLEEIKMGFKMSVLNTFKIPTDNIITVGMITEKDLIDSNSAISRGIAGALLLGPVGAIVGGISGIGRKKVVASKYFVISYMPSSGALEPKSVVLKAKGSQGLFVKSIIAEIDSVDKSDRVKEYLQPNSLAKSEDGSVTL